MVSSLFYGFMLALLTNMIGYFFIRRALVTDPRNGVSVFMAGLGVKALVSVIAAVGAAAFGSDYIQVTPFILAFIALNAVAFPTLAIVMTNGEVKKGAELRAKKRELLDGIDLSKYQIVEYGDEKLVMRRSDGKVIGQI